MKRKGFTLIELLAVIVILAIIAVIATPIIVGIIEDSRKAAFERSVEGIIHATDIDFGTQEVLSSDPYTISNGVLNKTLKTPIKNIDGFNGKIVYDEKGNSTYAIYNDKWCMTKVNGVITTTDYVEGECIIVIPTEESCFMIEDIEGGVTITQYVCSDKDVVIPSTIGGKNVLSITGYQEYDGEGELTFYGAFSWKDLQSVKFPNTLESIGDRAFYGNSISGELDLSNTKVKSIGNRVFVGYRNDYKITSVKFPSTLESIGAYAFEHNVISGELDLSNTKVKSIGDYAFNGNRVCGYDDNENEICTGGIASVKFPNTLESIGDHAFEENKITGELDLSNTKVKSIGKYAFIGYSDGSMNQIASVKFPNTLESIGDYAFEENKITGELDLSNTNIVSIGGFSYNQITSIKLPDSVTSIGTSAFTNNALTGELDLSYLINLTSVDGFSDNEITAVKFPNSLNNILSWAFMNNPIQEISMNFEEIEIGWGAFCGHQISEDSQVYISINNINKYALSCDN